MYQPPVIFRKFVAIDWSGAAEPIRSRDPIQVAEYVPATGIVRLVRRKHGNRWNRTSVVDYVQQTVNAVDEGPILIGFDFAFAYPYCSQDCDQGAYFPGVEADAPPQNPQELWATVERSCNGIQGAGNFYGAPFYTDRNSPYRQFYRYQANRRTCQGDDYEPRLRITDCAAIEPAGQQPNSVFNCVGQRNVGTGSVAGMRVLREFGRRVRAIEMALISIWPFNANSVPDRSTVVEIYPRLFLNHAEVAGINRAPNNLPALCDHFGAELTNPPAPPTKDQRDALVSAAGMGWFTKQGQVAWQVPARAAEYEGWIFGVPVPAP